MVIFTIAYMFQIISNLKIVDTSKTVDFQIFKFL